MLNLIINVALSVQDGCISKIVNYSECIFFKVEYLNIIVKQTWSEFFRKFTCIIFKNFNYLEIVFILKNNIFRYSLMSFVVKFINFYFIKIN